MAAEGVGALLCAACNCSVEADHACPYGPTVLFHRDFPTAARARPPAEYVDLFGDVPPPPPEKKAKTTTVTSDEEPTLLAAVGSLRTILNSTADLQDAITAKTNEANAKAAEAGELTKKLKAAEGEVARLSTQLSKKPAAAAPKPACDGIVSKLVSLVSESYTKKFQAAKAAYKPPPPPAPPPPPPPAPKPGPPVLMIIQKNTNPQYNTEREIKYEATNAGDGLFYFDGGSTPHAPNWSPMNAAISAQLLKDLGSGTPAVGATSTYSYQTNSYQVDVVMRPYPLPPPPPPPAPPAPPAPVLPWETDVLFKGPFVDLDGPTLGKWLDEYDFGGANSSKSSGGAGASIAKLAELFASCGTPTKFNSRTSELWVVPHHLKSWLIAVTSRGYLEARLCMHGMRFGPYDLLLKDPLTVDLAKGGSSNAKGFGHYVALSNEIATYYGASARNASNRHYPHGTALIGLLVTKPGALHNPTHGMNNGAMCCYPLSSNLGSSLKVQYPHNYNDAVCVRDMSIWLPLGLAMASK